MAKTGKRQGWGHSLALLEFVYLYARQGVSNQVVCSLDVSNVAGEL